MKNYDFSAVKQAISIIDFFELIIQAKPSDVASNGGRRYGDCPACGFHPNSHRVSVIEKGFNCFGCNAKGDVITAAELYWGVSKPEAAQKLVETFGGVDVPRPHPKPVYQAPVRDDSAFLEFVQKLKSAPMPEDGGVFNYLKSRGISMQTITEGVKRGLIVVMPDTPAHAGNWLKKYIGDDLLRKTKILKEGKQTPGVIYKPLCFIGDNQAAVEFRIAGPKRTDNDIKSIRYGSGSPWTWQGTKGVMVTEGVIDLLSAVELGSQRTIVAIPGCNSWKIEWFEKYKGEQILLALDADGPGVDAAKQMKSLLEDFGHDVHIYELPDGHKDLNERLVAEKRIQH
jgi:DNA primase